MKRHPFLLGICCAALLLVPRSPAVDFNLSLREAGPGHRARSYWWKLAGANWELMPPDHFALLGGGEIRLQKSDHPEDSVVCREATQIERDLFTKKDPAAADACFRTQLPTGIKNLQLVSQHNDPLPVNGLTNVEAVYSYELGGITYRAAFMVNHAVQQLDKTAAAAGAKPKEDYFTAVIAAPQEGQTALYEAFQQLMATARIAPKDPIQDPHGQFVSHGMLGS